VKLPIHIVMDSIGATLFEADLTPSELSFSTDTRTLQPGDAFVALHGDNYDGHDYTQQAIDRGASVVIINEPHARVRGMPAMLVDRTLPAYMALASAARRMFKGRVVAITGSSGKTTTKVLLAQMLAKAFNGRVTAAPANENNEIGVSRLLLSASNEEHDVIVVEMGARQEGDIAKLVAITRPDIGILTNVGDAHLGMMGSRAVLEETKWALFMTGARGVLNAADATSIERAPLLAEAPHWFYASKEPTAVAGRVTALIGRSRLVDSGGITAAERTVDVRLPGAHNCANLAAALAAALELGVPIDTLVAAIPALTLPEGRFESIPLANGSRLIFDAYNANASGTMAALDAVAEEAAERRIAVLGSMAELGDEADALHERVGERAAAKVDIILVGGEFAVALARGAQRAGLSSERIVHVATNAQAAHWLREHGRSGDVVLLKGSRKYKLEEIVKELLA
jgi:UDP-N-acetylmuramoyl-tripeptide--D-alanyl-D-alanine ligase